MTKKDKTKQQIKKMTEKSNLPFLFSQMISLSFIIPFSAIIWTIIYLTWAFNSPTTVQDAEWILSTDWLEGGSFLYVAFIWYLVTQALMVPFYIYFHFYDKTEFGTKYGSSLLMFNGFIYSQFLLVKRFLKTSPKTKGIVSKVPGVRLMVPKVALVGIIPLQLTLIGITFNHNIYTPTNLRELRLSSDPNHINVIEIFSDGIDDYVFDVIKDSDSVSESFKDFTFYENYVTTGTNTMRSYNTLTGGFKNSMLWKGEEFGFEVLGDVVPARMETIGLENKYVISPKFPVEKTGIVENEETGSVIQTANWGQAKDMYAGTFGTTYSPEYLKYKMMGDLWSHAPYGESSHIMISDHLYHFPYNTAADGTLGFTSGTRETGAHATASILGQAVNDIKDFYQEAYDNSLILVYGDHASHALPLETWQDPHDNMVKNRPIAAIKYPNAVKTEFDIVDDRTIFAPLLQDIIASNVADPTAGDTIIQTDDRFAMDQTFFIERPEGILLHEFDDKGHLHSLDEPDWLVNGWISWDDIYTDPEVTEKFTNPTDGYMNWWYNDVDFEAWDPSVYKGGNNA